MTSRRPRTRNILFASAFHAGSHRAWLKGFMRHTRHACLAATLPGRFWKWRMQGGAAELARQVRAITATGFRPDILVATDMVNLAALLGLAREDLPGSIPTVLYMHENQLTYPGHRRPDRSLPLVNWLSQLAADRIVFNSAFHRDDWFAHLPHLLANVPDLPETASVPSLQAKADVLPVGLDFPAAIPSADRQDGPLHILWNHRWEQDKRPDRFCTLLHRLHDAGTPFKVSFAGEPGARTPPAMVSVRERLAEHIAHWGYLDRRAAYWDLLYRADVVVSTTDHEFFGLSVLEALGAGAMPLLPHGFSYPELIPERWHATCLYRDADDLYNRVRALANTNTRAPAALVRHIRHRYSWPSVAAAYDEWLDNLGAPDPS